MIYDMQAGRHNINKNTAVAKWIITRNTVITAGKKCEIE